jgi:hypothetical protein
MPRGFREQYFVELVLDFDQKKRWAALEDQAQELALLHKDEIERQVVVLGTPVAKNFWMEAKSGDGLAPDIVEPARTRIREQVYDNLRLDLSAEARRGKKRNTKYSLEVLPSEVHFSVEAKTMRVPYLGLVRHRHNNKILSMTEATGWAMANTTSMRLAVKNQYLCLVIDTREDPSLKKKKKPPERRKSSKWLT